MVVFWWCVVNKLRSHQGRDIIDIQFSDKNTVPFLLPKITVIRQYLNGQRIVHKSRRRMIEIYPNASYRSLATQSLSESHLPFRFPFFRYYSIPVCILFWYSQNVDVIAHKWALLHIIVGIWYLVFCLFRLPFFRFVIRLNKSSSWACICSRFLVRFVLVNSHTSI